MTPGAEIAIVGFWRRDNADDPNSEFKCYYYFNCANPIKREIRKSDRKYSEKDVPVSAKQVLHVSSNLDHEIVYFIYTDHESSD